MDNQYSYYNPNETEGNTSNGTTFYNNGQGDDGKTPKKKKEHKKMPVEHQSSSGIFQLSACFSYSLALLLYVSASTSSPCATASEARVV